MNKKCIKQVMELIFIFILPLLIILANISCTKAMTYDENGNQLTEEKHIEYNNVILNEGSGNYINKIKVKELAKNNTPIYSNTADWLKNPSLASLTNSSDYIETRLINIQYNSSAYLLNKNDQPTYINHYYAIKMIYQLVANEGNVYITINEIRNNVEYILDQRTIPNGTNYIDGLPGGGWGSLNYIVQSTLGSDRSHIKFTWDRGTTTSGNQMLRINSLEMLDLTEMFGIGYEPSTIDEYNTYVNNQVFNYSQNGEVIEYVSNTQISENAEPDLTIWGKLKNLIIDNLQLTDNIIVDIILSYTIIWFIMFIVWHFFYLFFDGLVHIFIDWGHEERKKVK